MDIVFEGPALMVRDMKAAREFYETVLGQEVLFSVGEAYVAYQGKFSLWESGGASAMIFGAEAARDLGPGMGTPFELYFETTELDAAWERLEKAGVNVVHAIQEQPWGQRCFRVRDPEGRLVELGEPMPLVVKRYLDQGLSVAQVAERTLMPEAMVEAVKSGG